MEMRYNDYMNFKLYQIKEFLSLCENLNYTKAARECYVSQSTLSRNIQMLENTLGIQLFVRNTVKVTPTPAGRSLYIELKQIYQNYEEALMDAYRIQEGKSHPLTIGLNDGLDIMPELLPFLRLFYDRHPDFEINFTRDYDYSLSKNLEDHTYDLIFDLRKRMEVHSFVETVPLFSGPLYLYMLNTNPLCSKEALTKEDLINQQLLVRSPSKGSDQVDYMRRMYASMGVEPRFAYYVDNALELALNIHQDNQAILADYYYVGRHSPYLEARVVQGTHSTIWMKWLESQPPHSDVRIFVKELLEYFKKNK